MLFEAPVGEPGKTVLGSDGYVGPFSTTVYLEGYSLCRPLLLGLCGCQTLSCCRLVPRFWHRGGPFWQLGRTLEDHGRSRKDTSGSRNDFVFGFRLVLVPYFAILKVFLAFRLYISTSFRACCQDLFLLVFGSKSGSETLGTVFFVLPWAQN